MKINLRYREIWRRATLGYPRKFIFYDEKSGNLRKFIRRLSLGRQLGETETQMFLILQRNRDKAEVPETEGKKLDERMEC